MSIFLKELEKINIFLFNHNVKDVPVCERKSDRTEVQMSTNNFTSAHFIVNCKQSLSSLISINAKNPNSHNHEDANGRITLIAFELIAEYNLLIEIQNSSRVFSANID